MSLDKKKAALDTSKSPEQRMKDDAKRKAEKVGAKVYKRTLMAEAAKAARAKAKADAKRLK
jgi:hypothetical protein